MKRSAFKRSQKPLKRSKLRLDGRSTTAEDKRQIQDLARACVIVRDGGCLLYNLQGHDGIPMCNGYAKDSHLILQADHLITRANSATYADTRLIVCVCKGHHGWKKYHKEQYDAVLRNILPKDRVVLWERAQGDSWRPNRKYAADWKLAIVALKKELADLGGIL